MKFGNFFEKGPERSHENYNEDSRLSENQALLYQEYATKLAGGKFSEQVGEQYYEEAEQLLNKLKDSKFDWLDIDWESVDIKDISTISEIEERLDFVVNQLVKDGKDHNGVLAGLVGKFKGAIPMAMALAVLAGGVFPNEVLADSVRIYKNGQIENKGDVKILIDDARGNFLDRTRKYYETRVNVTSSVQKWLSENANIAEKIGSIIIETKLHEPRTIITGEKEGDITMYTDDNRGTGVAEVFAEIDKVTVLTKDKKAFTALGLTKMNEEATDFRSNVDNTVDKLYGEAIVFGLNGIKNQIKIEEAEKTHKK